MSPASNLVAAVAASAIVAFVVVALTRTEPPAPPDTDSGAEVAALREEVRALGARLDELASARPAEAVRASVDTDLDARVEAAVARALGPAGGAASAGVDDFSVDAAVVELLEGAVNPTVNPAVWARIRAAGKVDEVIEAFRRRAAENPNSADAQADLGEVLIAKVVEAENPMDQARHSMLADAAYDKALEIDPTHWRARFNKAVSYSFWPPITGKPAQAITHFETLIEQQEQRPNAANPGHVQSYVALGNLYAQQGKADKAREVWERGLRFHPDDAELAEKVGR